VKSEDDLYDKIATQMKEHSEFAGLLEIVQFEFLSNERFCAFVLWSEHHFDDMSGRIWLRVSRRLLICPQLRNQSKLHRHSTPPIDHSSDVPLNTSPPWSDAEVSINRLPFLHGIISSLRIEHPSTWHEFLKVTVSDTHSPSMTYHSDWAVNISPANGFASSGAPNAWIEYEFIHCKIYPTHYSLRSWFPCCTPNQWPRHWKLEGWTDSGDPIEIDVRNNNDCLQDHVVVTFPVVRSAYIRRIRFTETGPNKCNGHCIILSCFEIFGDIIQDL
jgi:hypothetical protein